jgi:hypothetical protein
MRAYYLRMNSHASNLIFDSELKHRLCKIDGNRSHIPVGLLVFKNLTSTPMKTRAPIWRKKP